MKTFDDAIISKIQMTLVKAKHPDFTWDEINKLLYALHSAPSVKDPELPEKVSTWEDAKAEDTGVIKREYDKGEKDNLKAG